MRDLGIIKALSKVDDDSGPRGKLRNYAVAIPLMIIHALQYRMMFNSSVCAVVWRA